MTKIKKKADRIYIDFIGIKKINLFNAFDIKEQIIVQAMEVNKILIFNFNNIKFIDSAAFNYIEEIFIEAFLSKNRIELISMNEDIVELFELFFRDSIFKIEKIASNSSHQIKF
jgi:anti-anti-sigma regulatory factor